jgi:hypothetical protein
MFLFKRMLLHQAARLHIPSQQRALGGVSIGLGTSMIFAAAQPVRPLAARLNARNPEED